MTRLLGSSVPTGGGVIGPAIYKPERPQPRHYVLATRTVVEVLDAGGRVFEELPLGHCGVASIAYAIEGWSMRMAERRVWVAR